MGDLVEERLKAMPEGSVLMTEEIFKLFCIVYSLVSMFKFSVNSFYEYICCEHILMEGFKYKVKVSVCLLR